MHQAQVSQTTQVVHGTRVAQTAQATTGKSTAMVRLYQLADRQCSAYIYEANRLQPLNESMHSPELYQLAVDVTLRPLILNHDLLNAFCEPAASALLMRLPNRYWFWSVLKSANLQVEDEGTDTLLTQDHVACALAEIRRSVTMKYNLKLPMAELSPAQIASRTAAGIILVKACFGELDTISFNPIFAPCPGTDGSFAESAAALTAALLKG
ncbi:hypothetical protein BH11CYA1_BH11CYA1_07320 [soil metagenome]